MRKSLLWIVFLTIPFIANAQFTQLPNGGFETWQNVGSSTEEPTEWNSLMTGDLCGLCGLGAQQNCFRESGAANVHSGSYSARIVTNIILGNPANGVMTLGRVTAPSTNANDGYNQTLTGNGSFNHALGDTPDSLVFWAKYNPQDGSDSGRVAAIIHDNYNLRDPQDGGSAPHVVGVTRLNFRNSNTWTRYSIPFNYTGPASSPDYILVSFTSSYRPGVGTANTTLWVDDVSLIYDPTLTTGTINPTVYYVSATQGANISIPYTLLGTMNAGNIVTAELSDGTGAFGSPTSLGTLTSTSSGTINGTIPAGTVSGSGYRVRVTSTNYPLTAGDNGTDIQINLVTTSAAPNTAQTVEANENGTTITVTESAAPTSREWKYSTSSGGPYTSFAPTETGTTYTPNFATLGTYYVVCESVYPGGITAVSNEIQIDVVDNAVVPSASQSLLTNSPGTLLAVVETPTGTSREWKFATTPGGPYSSFAPTQTGTSYTPLFTSAGTYYVICESMISGIPVTSNEVIISVGSVTLNTGTITGSPFLFSPSAPDANITVPYTISDTLAPGNIFTAELSDPSGSFASPTPIGSVADTMSGTINAVIPHTMPAGTGYRIRVVANNPLIYGADNGADLVIDQFNNSIAPTATQSILYNTNGTPLTVTESQTATVRTWLYGTSSGGPYQPIVPAASGVSYTPNFATPGTYYVVCASVNTYGDPVISNEVQIDVTNGTQLNTSAITTSGFYLSPNANVQVNVNFTSDIVFGNGNVFTAEISDASGSFLSPTTIGTLNGTAITTITSAIPNSLPNGSGYRIRVTSTNPPAVGTDNGSDLSVFQLESDIAPPDTQYLVTMQNGTTMNVSSSHPSVTHEWRYRSGVGAYLSFSPMEINSSYTPNFSTPATYQVTCYTVNQWSDTTKAQDVLIYVTQNTVGLDDEENPVIVSYWNEGNLWVNLTSSDYAEPYVQLMDMSGRILAEQNLIANSTNKVPATLIPGVYVYRITDKKDNRMHTGRFVHR